MVERRLKACTLPPTTTITLQHIKSDEKVHFMQRLGKSVESKKLDCEHLLQ